MKITGPVWSPATHAPNRTGHRTKGSRATSDSAPSAEPEASEHWRYAPGKEAPEMTSERETDPAIPNRVESIIALLVALGLSLLPLSEGMTKCLNMRVMDKTFDANLGGRH